MGRGADRAAPVAPIGQKHASGAKVIVDHPAAAGGEKTQWTQPG